MVLIDHMVIGIIILLRLSIKPKSLISVLLKHIRDFKELKWLLDINILTWLTYNNFQSFNDILHASYLKFRNIKSKNLNVSRQVTYFQRFTFYEFYIEWILESITKVKYHHRGLLVWVIHIHSYKVKASLYNFKLILEKNFILSTWFKHWEFICLASRDTHA